MKSTARVVVIGGGIAGCSTLYHLTQEGWSDVMLLERDELTSGTTWHSAAQVTNFGMTQTMVGLKSHSIALYQELAADPAYPINYHHGDGGIRLANTEAQMEGYRHFASMARGMGVEFEVIDVSSDQAQLNRMLERSNGRRTVPQIFIDELHVGGFDDLSAMDRDGKLDPLLGH